MSLGGKGLIKSTTINDAQLKEAGKANTRYSNSELFLVDCSYAHNGMDFHRHDHLSRTNLP
jgi:hypothetical protein